jgi:hypothetical protein
MGNTMATPPAHLSRTKGVVQATEAVVGSGLKLIRSLVIGFWLGFTFTEHGSRKQP